MPSFCAVINCVNRSNRDEKSFFRLPSIPNRTCVSRKMLVAERREKWLAALKHSNLTESSIKFLRICLDHFISG